MGDKEATRRQGVKGAGRRGRDEREEKKGGAETKAKGYHTKIRCRAAEQR